MRRDYIDVDVRNLTEVPDSEKPVVEVAYDGPDGGLASRLSTDDGHLAADDVDVTYRERAEGEGVLSLSNRLTGAFVLEANVDCEDVAALVERARGIDVDDESLYRVRLTDAGGETTTYDKRMLLVYDAEGDLRRERSLIPGGVEL